MAVGLHFGTFGLTFNTLGGSLGPPWSAFGPRPKKVTKKILFGTSFSTTFLLDFLTFLMLCFCVFFEPLSYQPLGAKSPASFNFEGLTGLPEGTKNHEKMMNKREKQKWRQTDKK